MSRYIRFYCSSFCKRLLFGLFLRARCISKRWSTGGLTNFLWIPAGWTC